MRVGFTLGAAVLAAGTILVTAFPAMAKAQPPVRTAVIKVHGKKMKVLEAANGHTLYYFTKNAPARDACAGACLKLWPPYKVKAAPAHVAGMTGRFSLFKGQLEYQGHQLYTYSGDHGPGQSHGEGFLRKWWVASPQLAPYKAAKKGGSGGSSGGGGW